MSSIESCLEINLEVSFMSCNSCNSTGIFAFGNSWWWIIALIIIFLIWGGNNGCCCNNNCCDNNCGCC